MERPDIRFDSHGVGFFRFAFLGVFSCVDGCSCALPVSAAQ